MPTLGLEQELDNMKAKLNTLVQERNSVLELLLTAENDAMKAKEDLKQAQLNCPDISILQQMENMKQDYSDAITLLDSKCRETVKDLQMTREKNAKLVKEIGEVNSKILSRDSELKELLSKLKVITKEKDELQSALEHCHRCIDEAKNAEVQARTKVSEAVNVVQEALLKEKEMAEEKAKLEKAMDSLIEEAGVKLGKEVELVKTKLNAKIESLTEQLQAETHEKNRLLMECKNIKVDCDLKVQKLTLTNEALTGKLRDIEKRQQAENLQFVSERDMLRRQILTLQSAVEHIPDVMREQQKVFTCQKCPELIKCIDRYRDMSNKYKRTAEKMAEVFEKTLNEERKEWRTRYQNSGRKN